MKFNSLSPLTAPFPSKEKVTGRLRRCKVCTEKSASTQLLWMQTRLKVKVQQRESWHPRGEPGLCTPGRSRRCGFRLPGLQPRTFRTRTTGSDARLHLPAPRPAARPDWDQPGRAPRPAFGSPAWGALGRDSWGLRNPESRCPRPRPTQGPGTQAGPPRTLVQTPAPDGRSACASELGSAKLLHSTMAPGRRPHGPSTCTHTRSPAPESAKILEKRARRVGGRGGVLTPPSCPLPPRPQPDPDAPAYLHARQARLHRGVGHGARRRHFLARDARSRAASRPGAARSPRVAGRALEPEATAPRGRSQRRLAGRGPIH